MSNIQAPRRRYSAAGPVPDRKWDTKVGDNGSCAVGLSGLRPGTGQVRFLNRRPAEILFVGQKLAAEPPIC